MAYSLPIDLIHFLRDGRQLEYDVSKCEAGQIRLKALGELAPAIIDVYPNCPTLDYDPYGGLFYAKIEGRYQAKVFDLVARCDRYGEVGMLCWFSALSRYGCIDVEHGSVWMFPDATWTDIVANPQPYLDAQWFYEKVQCEHVLPWIHFPFRLEERNITLEPYPSICPIHQEPVVARKGHKPELHEVMCRREFEDWFVNYRVAFPLSGLPLNDDEILSCSTCHSLENQWLTNVMNGIVPLDVEPNAHRWVQCPGCGIRFALYDAERFANGLHLTCGQKINVLENS